MSAIAIDKQARRLGWLGLVLALGAPVILILGLHSGLTGLGTDQRRIAGWAGMWAVTLAIFLFVRRGERRPLSSIGLSRLTAAGVAWGLLVGVLAVLAFPVCAMIIKALGLQSQTAAGVADLMALPLWARLATLVTAGVCEEVLDRGYPISRLKELTGSRAVAAIVPAVLFVGLHAPGWGFAHLLYVSVVTVMMTVLFLWRGDLWSNITAHLVTDGVPLLLMPLLVRH